MANTVMSGRIETGFSNRSYKTKNGIINSDSQKVGWILESPRLLFNISVRYKVSDKVDGVKKMNFIDGRYVIDNKEIADNALEQYAGKVKIVGYLNTDGSTTEKPKTATARTTK